MIPARNQANLEIGLLLEDAAATEALARALAARAEAGDCFLLLGDLGAGKSLFARAFIRALPPQSDEEIPSPTFTLVQIYEKFLGPLYHFDLYRLEHPEEANELGLEEALDRGLCLIEWPERLGPFQPEGALSVAFAFGDSPSIRSVVLTGDDHWVRRLKGLEAELSHG
jgi:tRNA threonylcarbamoyladenosine biosynthesis protein TsaE